MRTDDRRQYILSTLTVMSRERFPNDPIKQRAWITGFLAEQIAQSMLDDSKNLYRFRDAVENTKNKYGK